MGKIAASWVISPVLGGVIAAIFLYVIKSQIVYKEDTLAAAKKIVPILVALMAAAFAPDLPMAYLNFGGFGNTENIVRATRLNDISSLRNVVSPNRFISDSSRRYMADDDLNKILSLHRSSMQSKSTQTEVAGNIQNQRYYLDSLARAENITEFEQFLPEQEQLQQRREITAEVSSTLHQQIQLTLLAFKAGMSVSADLWERGYDTHSKHDETHPVVLANSTDAIDYLWSYAEELGLADRIVLVIGSDFSRTPYFNSAQGKDHWPIGSTIVMEKNAAFTNQVIGETDEGHNAYKISPSNLKRDDNSGINLKPAHVHKALRRYLNLELNPITQVFPFDNTEDLPFFG